MKNSVFRQKIKTEKGWEDLISVEVDKQLIEQEIIQPIYIFFKTIDIIFRGEKALPKKMRKAKAHTIPRSNAVEAKEKIPDREMPVETRVVMDMEAIQLKEVPTDSAFAIECKNCGRPALMQDPHAVFCSDSCRNQHWYKENKAKKQKENETNN